MSAAGRLPPIPKRSSITLCRPIARASRAARAAVPGPAAGGGGEFARTRSIFILDCHRSANRAGFRDVSSELQEVRMGHNSVRNIDSEVVGRIAYASLRHEDEIPRTIVSRPCVCGTG